MEFTYVLLLNFIKLILIPALVFYCFGNRSMLMVLGMAALLDFIIFYDELFYYESSLMFLIMVAMQLLILGCIFQKSNKQ